jgi:hypothetical protein
MYQWKFQNPPKADNWKGFTTQTIKNYEPNDPSKFYRC